MATQLPEQWLRGPVAGVPPLLQPVAHALLQAKDEVSLLMKNFPDDRLWDKPAGVASVGFHLQHLRGVLDRLLTYAEGKTLTTGQLTQLRQEGTPAAGSVTVKELLEAFQQQVDRSIDQLKATTESTLTEGRMVGRAQLPSTVIGLLFHAAEHTMRHTGQLHVTVHVLNQP